MGTYEIGEEALRQILIATDALNLTESTCNTDFDTVIRSMVETNINRGCLLTFNGGSRASGEPFQGGGNRGRVWRWRVYGVYFIRYEGDNVGIEKTVREAIDSLKGILDGDNMRLSGTVPYAEVIAVEGPPEDITINDMPFYLLGFTVEFWDKT